MIDILTQVGITLLMSFHFVCMDIAMLGPLAALWLAWRWRRHSDRTAREAGQWLMHLSWQALAVGMALGLTSGLLLWIAGSREFLTTLGQVSELRLYGSVGELVFYFCLIMPSAFYWDRLARRPVLQGVLALAAATNLIYHFPPLFVTISQMAGRGPLDTATDNLRRWLWDATVVSQVLHHVVGAAAVVGVALMNYAFHVGETTPVTSDSAKNQPSRVAVGGARLALGATLLQVPVGIWLVLEIEPIGRDAVLGSDLIATGLFLLSMLVAFGLLHYLAAGAMGDVTDRGALMTGVLLLVLITLMTGTLRRIRFRDRADARAATAKTSERHAEFSLPSKLHRVDHEHSFSDAPRSG